MNICRKCGAVLREGDRFCSKCGARAPSIKAQERRQNAQKRKQEKEITFRTKPANSRGYRENFEEGENRSHALLVTVTVLVVMMLAVAGFAMFYFMRKRSLAGGSGYGSAIEIISDSGVQENAPAIIETSGEDGSVGDSVIAESGQPADHSGVSGSGQPADHSGASDSGQPADHSGASGGGQASDIVVIMQGETQSEEAQTGDTAAQGESGSAEKAQSEEASAMQSESRLETADDVQTQSESEEQTESEAGEQTEAEDQVQTETEKDVPSAADVIDPEQIRAILDSESSATSTQVYIYDLKHDSEAALNDCTEPMYASALITIPILYTAAHQIDAGAVSLDDPITYVTSIGGRGELTTELRDGIDFPLSFYLQTMTNYSDNNCINILIDYFGLDTINSVCQEAGFNSVNMERGLVAGDPGGLDNYVSSKDITMMVKELYSGAFSSIGTDFMREYFHISEGDSLPTLVGLAPSLSDAVVLNQNGHGMTRYNETAIIEDGNAQYILTIMLHGDNGMTYSPAVTDVAEYVASAMAG